ncbi:hypothetical protein PsYK624_033660 [Phanerochaete sordida]|uniref:Uncharacterized protein n=1 Tax=Phanerochaete sordida TaxID=48140 RepID=A0A9P3LAS5_9APHY|nr:hypothetical protein PsYK624_033660 [Phanerochaete sordida]
MNSISPAFVVPIYPNAFPYAFAPCYAPAHVYELPPPWMVDARPPRRAAFAPAMVYPTPMLMYPAASAAPGVPWPCWSIIKT